LHKLFFLNCPSPSRRRVTEGKIDPAETELYSPILLKSHCPAIGRNLTLNKPRFMRKNYACLCLIFMMAIGLKSYAQLKAGTIKTADGGTVTTKGPENDDKLNETWKSEYKSKDGTVTRRITYKKDLEGKWTSSSEELTPSGRVTETMDADLDVANGRFRIEKFTSRWFNKRTGKATEQVTGEIDHVTALIKTTDSVTKIVREIPIDEMNKMNQDYLYPFIHANETTVSLNPVGNGNVNCGQNFFVSLGPSYLSRDFGDEKKSAWGVHLLANYNFNKHITAGIDLSTYSVKIGDEKLTTSFYMLDGVYTFGKGSQECPPHISIFARIAIGMINEKFAGGSGSGPVYGAGLGSDYRISNNFSIGVGFDYLRGKFEDEGVSNVRGSVFATFRFGRTPV